MNICSRSSTALIIVAALIAACNPLQSQSRLTLFDDSFQIYSKYLRWGHFREATSLMTDKHRLASLAKISGLKDIRISRVQATQWIMNEEKDRISGSIEISYYLTNQAVIRQIIQQQTWLFKDKVWRLDTGLPELR